jgi:hypothetical protein
MAATPGSRIFYNGCTLDGFALVIHKLEGCDETHNHIGDKSFLRGFDYLYRRLSLVIRIIHNADKFPIRSWSDRTYANTANQTDVSKWSNT